MTLAGTSGAFPGGPPVKGGAVAEHWPLRVPFVIARSRRETVTVVRVSLHDGTFSGQGECQPNDRYGHSAEAVVDEVHQALEAGLSTPADLHGPGAPRLSPPARNALDCALWDLAAKRAGRRVWDLLGVAAPAPLATAFTISLDTPDAMAAAARDAAGRGLALVKLKLGRGLSDLARVGAVRDAAPDAALIVDANEGWGAGDLPVLLAALADAGVRLVEQPLPAGADAALAEIDRPVPVFADESIHGPGDLPTLKDRYDGINLKLDKTGGLTEALRLADRAAELGMTLMVGSMLGTSLAMAPGLVLASSVPGAPVLADLDGPLLLSRDRAHSLAAAGPGRWAAPDAALWG
ncbi:dipeptide epimerase [Yunchengibacter salinarum]|uniref:dipeptide epimerase n=1 Tax=Yunchengibacter salinarum TaxID=3133399 RepID=UPI0035B6181C